MVPTTPFEPSLQTPGITLFANIDQMQLVEIVFGLIFIVWLIYTLIVAYHWIRYGHRSWLTIPLFMAHIVISVFLFVMAASGFATL